MCVITLLPSLVLLLAISPRLYKVISKHRLEGVRINPAYAIKFALAIVALVIQITFLARLTSNEEYPSSTLISTIISIVSMLGAVALHHFEHFNMLHPSTILTLYWLSTSLFSIFPTRLWIEEKGFDHGSEAALKLCFTVISFLVFALENIPKPHRKTTLSRRNQGPNNLPAYLQGLDHGDNDLEKLVIAPSQSNPSPEPWANFFARISFLWLLPLLRLGKKKALKMEDIWSLHPKLLSYPLYITTKAKLDADEAIARQKEEARKVQEEITDEKRQAKDNKGKKDPKSYFSLSGIIMYTVGWGLLSAAIPRLLYIATAYVRPILFKKMIGFMSSYSKDGKPEDKYAPQEVWIGYGLLIAILVSSVLASLFDAQFRNICFNTSLKARGVLVNLIYRKSLRLSTTTRQEGMGAIVNHMSADVDKVVALFQVIHYFWSSLLEITIAVVLLYDLVQYAIFASVGVIIVIIMINAAGAPVIGKHQKLMMKHSDHRMKLITELVNSIKAVKLYAWERYFADKISNSRAQQLKELRLFFSWLTAVTTLMNSIAPFAILTTLSVYTLIAKPENPLDTERIFTTITLINMIDGPVWLISDAVSNIVSGKVAFDRLESFLQSEEIEVKNVVRNKDSNSSDYAFEIENGTFGWYTPAAIEALAEKREKEAKDKAKKEAKDKNKKATEKKTQPKDESTNSGPLDGGAAVGSSDADSTSTETDKEGMRDSFGPVLHDIQLQVKRGSLTAVVGRVGEGKSSFVAALLGEMYKYSGNVRSFGSLAYVAQSAWILNDTVRNNILFGRPFDRERYMNTVRACALIPDFKMLINGDRTVIGEKGISLSGGQKQRVSIARAVYADADVYIFDDPLSAVDAHVDKHIFEHAFQQILANKTRILVTNGVSHLHQVDQLVVIKAGRISEDGSYEQLIRNEQGDLYKLVQESKTVVGKEDTLQVQDKIDPDDDFDGLDIDSTDEDETEPEENPLQKDVSVGEQGKKTEETRPAGPTKRPTYHRNKSSKRQEDGHQINLDETDEVNDEVVAQGRVGWTVYKFFLSKLGWSLIPYLMVSVSFIAIEMGSQLWLQRWGNDNASLAPKHTTNYWISTYSGWVMSSTLMLLFEIVVSMLVMAQRSSRLLHSAMLGPMIRSPMSFFDVTSSGNRFSHDITAIDFEIPLCFLNLTFITLNLLMILGFCVAATPYFAIILLPVGVVYFWLGGFYLISSREIKRLDSAARSPLYAHFGETLAGLVTIRAYEASDRLSVDATTMLDRSQQTGYLNNATTRWLAVMLDQLSTFILCIVSLLAVLQRESVQAGIYSIVLSQIGSLTMVMNRFLATSCQLETSAVSIERVREYSQLPSEAPDEIPDSKTDKNWPSQGQITFHGYSTKYREGLDPVLRQLDLNIRPGERIGVVGRTGAGKSSVTMALFRIIEATEGSIEIDGVDISTLGLMELRSRLMIIPQDPFLFGDTVRANLDPFNEYKDVEIWSALESASIKGYIATLADGLSTTIENGGENMSLGQRQLMSLARAMLKKNKTKILCLDEATAAIDVETDNAIQRALRREFQNVTILTIAHRIHTIMDSDRILVLDAGKIAEFESPEILLKNKESIFYGLASQSNNV
ncbi:hypothetical protein BGW38_007500 [Lunasporangiospora selenospora]|uniref:Uncharacterized protein n=1 Tax=Lunasporangiospora selenospora TaxID=979761 RepID=A0A9P6FYH4_9FUNG|nr:hypothetical protein BGW38_007500 [Lunasporangiospora selenospora]